ncbi:MAG: exosortase [Planctomycetota bacterium]|jgi:exosortase
MLHKQSINKQSIKAIILAGSRDFGRCPLASHLPTALWPVAGKLALEQLLRHLSRQSVKQVTVCSNGDAEFLQGSIGCMNSMQLKFLDEPLPVGTAGCIRDAVNGDKDALFLVLPAGLTSPPNIDSLIRTHRAGKACLTVMLEADSENNGHKNQTSGVYICETEILEFIPEKGYCDIKESVIPSMVRAGKTIHVATLPKPVGNFRDRGTYLTAIAGYLENTSKLNTDLKIYKHNDFHLVWRGSNVNIEQGARICGPVVIMDGATLSRGALIFGPTIIGRNVSIGQDTVVVNSVLWDSARVGKNCCIEQCVIDYNAAVPANTIAEQKSVPFKPRGILESLISRLLNVLKKHTSRLQNIFLLKLGNINKKFPNWVQSHKRIFLLRFATVLVLTTFFWSYWPGFMDLWRIWQRSDEYSSGLLVPFLAVYILWSRRHEIALCHIGPSVWGIFAFLVAQGIRILGLFFIYGSAERLSIALSIAALVLLLFGWQFFRKVATVLLFLCLMLPWPNRVQAAVALPLQRWATSSSVFCLEMLGYPVVQEGNIIHVGRATVAVAEACNGLRMITAFFIISGLVAFLVKRAWWEKLIILASSLPIALLCNSVRLTLTAVAFTVLNGEYWERIFHNFGGYAMMPLALAAVVTELWLLTTLTTLPMKKEAIIIERQKR